MVKYEDVEVYGLSETERPPLATGGESPKHHYSDTICLTKAPEYLNPTRYYRSTYDFSAPRRFKTVVKLKPTLAPIRYYRAINFGISRNLRHKSTVDCDFRPKARGFSETTWIFPKHGRDIYKSTLERNQLVDTAWYKSQVKVVREDDSERENNCQRLEDGQSKHRVNADYASTDEGVFDDGVAHCQRSDGFSSSGSSGEESLDYATNNNSESKLIDNHSSSIEIGQRDQLYSA